MTKIKKTNRYNTIELEFEGMTSFNTFIQDELFWSKVFTTYCNELATHVFGKPKRRIKVTINKRLSTTAARYMIERPSIQISHRAVKMLEVTKGTPYFYPTLEGVAADLRHEVVHYMLAELDKPSHDGDYYFESVLAHIGAPSSGYTDDKYAVKSTLGFTVVAGFHKTCEDCGRVSNAGSNSNNYYCDDCSFPHDKYYAYLYGKNCMLTINKETEVNGLEPLQESYEVIKNDWKEVAPLAYYAQDSLDYKLFMSKYEKSIDLLK